MGRRRRTPEEIEATKVALEEQKLLKKQEREIKKAAKEKEQAIRSIENKKVKEWILKSVFNKVNWASEMKMFNSLLEKYPKNFILSLSKKVPSLAWFIGSDGQTFLNMEKAKWDYTPSEFDIEYVESETAVELPPIKKQQTLRDFYGKE